MQTMTTDLKTLAARYIEAAGAKDYGFLEEVLALDVAFKGPFMACDSAEAFVGALRRMAPIWERNVIRALFSEGDRACVVYDFVTSTEAGAISTVELLTFRGDRIQSVELLFDRVQFAPAANALAQRAAK